MKSEAEIREYIEQLEKNLKINEELYPKLCNDYFCGPRLLRQSYNIESQLYALYYVLGIEYKYKHL